MAGPDPLWTVLSCTLGDRTETEVPNDTAT